MARPGPTTCCIREGVVGSVAQAGITIATPGRGFVDVTGRVAACAADAGVDCGIVQVFALHTSCSLLLGKNADPAVRRDLERWFARAVVDGDPLFSHTAEGRDDMSAHIRSILAGVSVSVPLQRGRMRLGTWQAIYLWEHRRRPHQRTLSLTVLGVPRVAA